MSLQLSRSPYYIKYVPSTSTPAISYGVVSVFIWSDTPANIPTTPTYTINKTVIGSDQFIVLEFSSLINDFIQVEFNNYTTGDIKNYYLETSCVFYDSSNAVFKELPLVQTPDVVTVFNLNAPLLESYQISPLIPEVEVRDWTAAPLIVL